MNTAKYFDDVYGVLIKAKWNKTAEEIWVDIKGLYEKNCSCEVAKRRIREIISDMRRAGYLILSDEHGYFLSNDKNEIKQAIAKFKSHAAREMRSARMLEKLCEKKFSKQRKMAI